MFGRNDDEYIRPSEEYISDCGIDDCHENYDYGHDSSNDTYNSSAVQDEMLAELEFGEKILWSGKADRSAPSKARKSLTGEVLFPIFWTAFAVLWTLAVFASGSIVGSVFGVPFIVIGLIMMKNMIFCKKQEERYCITNKNLIIKSKTMNVKYELRNIKESKVTDCGGGYGYINIKISPVGEIANVMGNNVSCNLFDLTMYALRDPKEVYRILRNAIIAAKSEEQ